MAHHSLRLYRHFRENALRYYIFQAQWTRMPLIGKLVRRVALAYGRGAHGACALTYEEALQVVEASPGLWLGPCRCRKVFRKCRNPVEMEIMVGVGGGVLAEGRPGEYRPISKEEAQGVLLEAKRLGLVSSLLRCGEHFYALCNCCPCCCVPWRLRRDYNIGTALVRDSSILSGR